MIADRIRSIQAVSGGGGGGFDPSQLSGLKLWLKADTGVTVDGSGNVSSWADQSGNGLDATQTDAAKRPVVTTNAINGKPAITFNGTSQHLTTVATGLPACSVFGVVARPWNTPKYAAFFGHYYNSTTGQTIVTAAAAAQDWAAGDILARGNGFTSGSNPRALGNPGSMTSGEYLVLSATLGTAGSAIRRKGVNFTRISGNAAITDSSQPIFVGHSGFGSDYWDGSIAELIIFDRVLTDSERMQVDSYIHSTYYTGVDPYYDASSLILNMQGTAGGTTFVDESPNALTVTPYGDAELVSDATFGTVASFDGSGDYLDTPNTTALDLPNDFTIEAWFYGIGLTSTSGTIIGKWQNPVAWALLVATDKVQIGTGNNGSFVATHTFSTTITNGGWNHVAISRSGTSIKCFLNGSQIGSTITSSVNLSATSTTDIGRLKSNNGNYFNGLIGPLRITKGVARDTANFTPSLDLFPTDFYTNYTLPVSGAALWLDGADSSTLFTDAGVTPVIKSGDLIYQWSDKSGNNRHATQATSGNRPSWVPPASGQNGFGAVQTNGNSQWMSGTIQNYSAKTMIVVTKLVSVSGGGRIFVESDNTTYDNQSGGIASLFITGSQYVSSGSNVSNIAQINTSVADSKYHRLMHIYNNGSITNYVDSTTATGSYTVTKSVSKYWLGVVPNASVGWYNGLYCEVIHYPFVLNSSQIASIDSYLKSKWGMTY